MSKKLPNRRLGFFIFSLLLPFLAGAIGSAFTYSAIPVWYAGLLKPSFNPPNYLFGPVWSLLYLLMGYSFYLVLKSDSSEDKKNAVRVFVIQLVLNSLWSIGFFGLRSPILGVFVIIPLWMFIFVMITRFYRINKIAGLINIPYFLWVSFASLLNISIFILN